MEDHWRFQGGGGGGGVVSEPNILKGNMKLHVSWNFQGVEGGGGYTQNPSARRST